MRRAAPSDVEALVLLRERMFIDMGTAPSESWQDAAASWFRTHIKDLDVCIAVADLEDVVVACALGVVRDVVPSPSTPSGRVVTVSNVCTLPEARGRGLGRAVTKAVMKMATSRGAVRADLFASEQGVRVYRSLGFRATDHPAMRVDLREVPA